MQYCLIRFLDASTPQITGPFDSEFAATHYHDTHFTPLDTVLLLPMQEPIKEKANGGNTGDEPGPK